MSEHTVCMYVNLLLSTTQLKKTMLCNKVKQNSQYYWLNVSSIKNLMYHLLSLFKIDTILQKLAMWNNCRITEFWIGSDFGDNCCIVKETKIHAGLFFSVSQCRTLNTIVWFLLYALLGILTFKVLCGVSITEIWIVWK